MESFFNHALEELSDRHLLRQLRTLTDWAPPYAALNGRKTLLFCGNDYLGFSVHPRLIQAASDAAKKYGVGAGASRLISGTTELHLRVEEQIAKLKGKERALLFSSGYAANVGLLSALAGEKDLIMMDKLNHASLIDGARLSGAVVRVFPHKHYDRLREILAKNRSAAKKFIVTDSVFSMDGDLADLLELVKIKKEFGAFLIIDDAHGTGVLGTGGRGAAEHFGVESEVDVIMGTSSKALGCLGGFVAASGTTIDYLINHARSFIYSTAMPPVLCGVIEEALKVLQTEPQHLKNLWKNVDALRSGLEALGLLEKDVQTPIFPVMMHEEARAIQAAHALLDEGILIPAVRTPTVPKGQARLRLTVSAIHTQEQILKVLEVFKKNFYKP